MCIGYKEGTKCNYMSRSPQNRDNWNLWQLCYYCARKLHPEYYRYIKHHGVNKVKKF